MYSITLRLAMVLVAGIVLQGCNTTEGLGKDLTSAGQAVSEAAQENKDY
ncbi:entericidin A/B family lipoprotein [Seohaeicola saemankumensis]|uniref:Entericidin A/B family lipoprotein n=1 Tax=Seohaeicola saemankumensis TaxID=481181 RepID=A0ABW3TKT2_9RHOB